jgi:hypothetical protein
LSLTVVIGRDHSGTRAISHTLSESGVYVGEPLNKSGDLLPPEDMYEAARVFGRCVCWRGELEWDWSQAFLNQPTREFAGLQAPYLAPCKKRIGV